jgi:hypothetical protein
VAWQLAGHQKAGEQSFDDADKIGRMPTDAPTPTPVSLLVNWANNQEGWVRQVVGEVITTRNPLSDEAAAAIAKRFLDEKGLGQTGRAPVSRLGSQQGEDSRSGRLRLNSLSNCINVNALAPEQRIEFHPNITILIGDNGAGKSGYARVLKTLASVRSVEAILPNVHMVSPGPPEAEIEFTHGSHSVSFHWTGEVGPSPLDEIAVFDTPAMKFHVDEALSFSQTPADLALFPMVTDGLQRVRELLRLRVAERNPGTNHFVSLFRNDTEIFPRIQTLGATSDLNELTQLGTFGDAESAELGALDETVQALISNQGSHSIEALQSRLQVVRHLGVVSEAIRAFDEVAYANVI